MPGLEPCLTRARASPLAPAGDWDCPLCLPPAHVGPGQLGTGSGIFLSRGGPVGGAGRAPAGLVPTPPCPTCGWGRSHSWSGRSSAQPSSPAVLSGTDRCPSFGPGEAEIPEGPRPCPRRPSGASPAVLHPACYMLCWGCPGAQRQCGFVGSSTSAHRTPETLPHLGQAPWGGAHPGANRQGSCHDGNRGASPHLLLAPGPDGP